MKKRYNRHTDAYSLIHDFNDSLSRLSNGRKLNHCRCSWEHRRERRDELSLATQYMSLRLFSKHIRTFCDYPQSALCTNEDLGGIEACREFPRPSTSFYNFARRKYHSLHRVRSAVILLGIVAYGIQELLGLCCAVPYSVG